MKIAITSEVIKIKPTEQEITVIKPSPLIPIKPIDGR